MTVLKWRNPLDEIRHAIWSDQLSALDAHYKDRAARLKTKSALQELREEYKRVAGPIKRHIARCIERSASLDGKPE